MAYLDMYNKINANITKYSTPKKKYADETARRGWLQNWKELGQGLESTAWQRGQSMGDLRDDVTGAAYDTRNTRGTWGGDAFNKGMVGVNHAYEQNLQRIQSGIYGQLNAEYAYNNRPRGGGRPKRPRPPKAPVVDTTTPTVQRALMDKRLYSPDTYEGQSTGLYGNNSPASRPAVTQYQLRSREMY